MSPPVNLRLQEWSKASPDDEPALRGRALPPELRGTCDALARAGKVSVLELSRGLRIATTSWVGRLRLGDLTLTIEPKLAGMPLSVLLRYAYGLRDLQLHERAVHVAAACGLQDLLVRQLVAEARELVARGLHREYARRNEELESPRGRVDFAGLAATLGRARAVLPCEHHPRTEANALNVALYGATAGKLFAAGRAKAFPCWTGRTPSPCRGSCST